MSVNSQPAVTVTQPKVAFILSVITLAGLVYTATDKLVRHQVEFDALKASYSQLSEGQAALRSEMKSLRETVDGEIRHMTLAINRLSDTLEVTAKEAME